MAFEIRVAETAAEVAEVFRFRYQIHSRDLSRPQQYADHVRQQIKDPLDLFARHIVAYEMGHIVGAVRSNPCAEGEFGPYEELYGLKRLGDAERRSYSVTSRLIVSAHKQRSRLLVELAKSAYAHNLRQGARHDLTDCKPPLPRFFRRLGYRTIRKDVRDQEGSFVEVMRLCMLDAAALERLRSPLLTVLNEMEHSRPIASANALAHADKASQCC